jgi:hypothetical protein
MAEHKGFPPSASNLPTIGEGAKENEWVKKLIKVDGRVGSIACE